LRRWLPALSRLEALEARGWPRGMVLGKHTKIREEREKKACAGNSLRRLQIGLGEIPEDEYRGKEAQAKILATPERGGGGELGKERGFPCTT